MKRYCVVSGIHSQLLLAFIKQALSKSTGCEVVEAEIEMGAGAENERTIDDEHIDMIVCEMGSEVIPQQCQAVFQRNRSTVVVGLVNDARQLAIFADDADLGLLNHILEHQKYASGRTA